MTPREYVAATNYAKILISSYCRSCKTPMEETEWDTESHRRILRDLNLVNNLLSSKKNYFIFLILSSLSDEKSNRILEALGKELTLNDNFLRFLKFVVYTKRIHLFPGIVKISTEIILEKMKTEECSILTSHELPEKILPTISKALSKKLAKKVNLTCSIKKDLILGIQIFTKHYLWEFAFAQVLKQTIRDLKLGINNEK